MSGLHFRRESSVVREVASLGTVAIGALLFLAFLTTLRPIAITVVQGDKVIDARADEAHYRAVFVVADALLVSEAAQIAKLSLKYQLPSMHQVRAEAEAGGHEGKRKTL